MESIGSGIAEQVEAENHAFDTIVIGSGMGGLTAASLLAQIEGLRVLVLEKHFEIGGFTHAFRRKGYSFDVGLHYVGQMQQGSFSRRIMDAVTGGEVSWNAMPEVYERFVHPFGSFGVPSDPEAYRKQLRERFPEESRAISRYFRDLERAAGWIQRDSMARFLPGPLAPFLRGTVLGRRRLALERTQSYMDRRFTDERLKRLLLSQWGDYGIPPRESSFALHALIVQHYLHGGFYPAGGAERIARAAESIIEAKGGRILFQSEALRILTEEGTARGVRVRHHPGGEIIDYYASSVISDVGARRTFEQLLPTHVGGRAKRKLSQLRSVTENGDTGNSAVILFLGLKDDPRRLGIEGENYWVFGDQDHSALRENTRLLLEGDPQAAYISFPSLKAGDERPHTAEIISLVDPREFAPWMQSSWGERGGDYVEMKRRVSEGLLAVAESAIPGFRDLVDYAELATPATIRSFTSRDAGRMYGLAGTPRRYKDHLLKARTPIEKLYLTGSDIVSPGIVGAAVGGLGAAIATAGPAKVFPFLYNPAEQRRAREEASESVGPTPHELRQASGSESKPQVGSAPFAHHHLSSRPTPIANDRVPATVVEGRELAPDIVELRVRLPWSVAIRPGQYARVEVSRFEWRDYSIADYQELSDGGMELLFVIDTSFGGAGSIFARSAEPGRRCTMRLPAGEFCLHSTGRRPVFVATGTGLSPLIAMIRRSLAGGTAPGAAGGAANRGGAARTSELAAAPRLFFGCRNRERDLSARYLAEAIRTDLCLSREYPPEHPPYPPAGASDSRRLHFGYVTDALRHALFTDEDDPRDRVDSIDSIDPIDPRESDFYICGNPDMVRDVEDLLRSAAADRVYTERY